MGGGRGTRLYPLTKLRCKPAVPLAGKYRLVDIPISNCINSGYNRIYLLSQFNTASLHRHVQDAYRFDRFGHGFVEILSAEQTVDGDDWYQGTADAVRRNLIHFGASPEDIFVILSGDQLYRMDFSKMVEEHLSRGADVTVAAKPVPAAEAFGLGLLRIGDESRIIDFVEKPNDPEIIQRLIPPELQANENDPDRCLASMGIYVFNGSAMFDALEGDRTDFGKEIIPSLVGKKDLRCHVYDEYWEDIGTVRAFFEANLQLCDEFPKFNFYEQNHPIYNYPDILPTSKFGESSLSATNIASGCQIGSSNFTRCMLGVRSIVGDACTLRNVVMMGADNYGTSHDNIELGVAQGTYIEETIIDKNARIGSEVVLSPKGLNEGWVDEKQNIYCKDGILVVVKNGVVENGTKIGNPV
ncbi:MAG: glucose-1-phosphate adenylyltransferase [Verrucomicrobia bacterium TMED56]|nr:MAG: glucose-1-phosphate adenylyltransferase [Verrucomicrobia bacterium TMED56]